MSDKNRFLKNDFMRLHAVFMTLYMLTFIAGWLRTSSSFFYKAHPLIAMSSVIIPLIVYIVSKNKKVIHRMILSNFTIKGKASIKVAKISTLVIMFYYLFSVVTGFLLNNELYSSGTYQILHNIHGLSKILVPLAVGSHVISRMAIKAGK